MVGGVVGGMFGGPAGAQIGSMIGGQVGKMLGEMIGQFGSQNVAGGLANCVQQDAANVANQHVDNCGMPQFIKDEMRQFVQSWMQDNMQNVPSDCQQACSSAYDAATNNNSGATGEPVPGGSDCTRTEGGNSPSTGGASENGYDDAYTNASYGCAESAAEEGEEGKGKTASNWLVALAGALSEVQAKFLNAAMDNMDTMEKNSSSVAQGSDKESEVPENETPEQKETREQNEAKQEATDKKNDEAQRNEFLKAQSQYQANMQMFNMMANMTATSLKSLGEGLTSIARKQ
ncbi:MAG: hypothetical protein ABW170_15120 [Candidatus Thiodiazotropha sp. L084R]